MNFLYTEDLNLIFISFECKSICFTVRSKSNKDFAAVVYTHSYKHKRPISADKP